MDEETETATKKKEKRIDLSVAQVAGSALAAAAAAYLAGQLGVYGTIIGAGVVSVVATTGGSIFQHLFRRTGEQIKEASVATRPKPRRSSLRTRSTTQQARQADPTMVLPTFDKQGTEDKVTSVAARVPGPATARTQLVPRAEQARRRDPASAHPLERTQLVPRLEEPTTALSRADARAAEATPAAPLQAGRPEEVSTATYGTRLRGWKRPALGALVVFVLAMGGVTATELLSGQTASGDSGTTLGNITRTGGSGGHQPDTPKPPGTGHSTGDGGQKGGGDEPSPDPGTSGDDRSGEGEDKGTPAPTPSPSGSGKTSPDPDPDTSPSTEPSPDASTGSDGDTGSGDGSTGGAHQESGQRSEGQAPTPGAS